MITDLIVMAAAQCPLYKRTTSNSYVRQTLQVWGRLPWRAAGTPVFMEGCPRECQTARRVNQSDLRQSWVPYFHTECKIRAGKCHRTTAAARARKRRRPQSFVQPTAFFEHAKQKLCPSASASQCLRTGQTRNQELYNHVTKSTTPTYSIVNFLQRLEKTSLRQSRQWR